MRDTVHVGLHGQVTRGMKVPHRAANIVGDYRAVAAPPRISRTRRFAPSGIPKGVRMDTTLPHDCANHLRDVADIERGF